MIRGAARWVVFATGCATGCSGPQYALDPRGPGAAQIEGLWWLMFGLATGVSLAVTALLLWAVHRARGRGRGAEYAEIDGVKLVWGAGFAIPVLIILPLLFVSFRVATPLYPPAGGHHALVGVADPPNTEPGPSQGGAGAPLTVEVTGHQYWWEVRYPEYGLSTANEIHIPVGRQVRLRITSPDVIHSFWVPQLHGKIDMLPGRVTTLWMEATRGGRIRGQCAEYCGLGHALMAFWVVALPPEEFEEWLRNRAAELPEPDDPEVARGREIFLTVGCGHCHATRGLPLPSHLGSPAPDLTHLAARQTLAAGTLPNTRHALESWIRSTDSIKPGSRMPPTDLPRPEMDALLSYLETLR